MNRVKKNKGQACLPKPAGQALVEFVISLIVLPIFFIGIIHLTQVLVVRIRLVQAARHGVWLVSTGRVTEATTRREVENFLTTGTPRLARNNIRNITFRLREGPFSLSTVSIEYELRTFQFTDNFFRPIQFTNVLLTESATVGHVSAAGTPYLAF